MKRTIWRCLLITSAVTACTTPESTTIRASGTIEIVEFDIAALVPARILYIDASEGDSVSAGDTLVRLTQSTLIADIQAREARVQAAIALLRDLEAGARPAELQRAEAELRSAAADVDRTASELRRADALIADNVISQAQHDNARSAAAVALARKEALEQTIVLLREGTREARIGSARAEVNAARASLAGAVASAQDLVLTAPASGVVLTKHAEAGEVIGAGVPALTVGDLSRPWVKVFVAASALASLRQGQDGLVLMQGADSDAFVGRIVAVDGAAQFTPRIALTESERADMMFGVKVQLPSGVGQLKAGLPVDVHFDTTGLGFPAALTEGRTVHQYVVPPASSPTGR